MSYIQNPQVPYMGGLFGVGPGMIIQITGQPHPNSKWFAINLQCGPNVNPRDDIALHLNPRFEGNMSRVVRNTLLSQQWGMEENFGHFPFMPGQPFEIMILIEQDHFKVAINGQHYTDFRFRMPCTRITTLAVDGEVQVSGIRTEPARAPSPQPGYGQATGYAAPGMPPSQPYMAAPQSSGYYPPQGAAAGYGQAAPYPPQAAYGYHATSAPLSVPGHSPHMGGRHSPMMGGAAGLVTGAVGGALASRLMYPGYGHMGGYGHHGKMKKMFKHKFHKPKFHKMKWHKPKFHKFKHFKHKFKKGWHHQSSSSSSGSSSSESE